MRDPQIAQMHWDIMKLLSKGIDEKFLQESKLTPTQTRDLVKDLGYLRERCKEEFA